MSCFMGRSAAAALLPAALTMRMFWGMSIDHPDALNASWICPLLGFIFFIPLGFAIRCAERDGEGGAFENLSRELPAGFVRTVSTLFALLLLFDCAVAVRLTASSSNLIALKDITVHLLIVPLAFVVACVVLLGGDAVGYSARIWLKVLPVFAVIMLLVQIGAYRIGWLTPILGSGIGNIIGGGIRCAGNMALISLVWLLSVPDRNRRSVLRYAAFSAIGASVLLAIQAMSFPSMINIDITRAGRIELLLSNGRMTRSPQLLLDILWYGGLLYLIGAEAVGAAAYIRRSFSKIPLGVIAAAEAALIAAAAIYNVPVLRYLSWLSVWMFVIIGGLLAVLLILACWIRRHCGFDA